MTALDAVVVGAGPNGLTAAARLAVAGHRVLVIEAAPTIGGGCRTAELLEPGIRHDICAAVHPSGAGSPAFRALRLEEHGLVWCHPPLALAHPLDGDEAAILDRDVGITAAALDPGDGDRYEQIARPLLARWDGVADAALGPIVRVPSDLPAAVLFAAAGIPPVTLLARRFRGPRARALLGGLAAHSFLPLGRPFTSGVGLTLGLFAHVAGWPVAEGGSQSVVDALARVIVAHGGQIETGRAVRRLAELPPARATLLDVTPRQLVALADGRLDHGWRGRPYRRFRYGPSVVKADYVLTGPMPWRSPDARRAGTVHLGGHLDELVRAEATMAAGGLPARPYALVAQPAVADPSRAVDGRQPLWAYTHVHRDVDPLAALGAMESQFDRWAPGWRDLVAGRAVRSAVELEAYNANNVDGDIGAGALTVRQLVARPRLALDPYATPLPGVWLCSASTPPGAGVHGMAGWHAAGRVERALRA